MSDFDIFFLRTSTYQNIKNKYYNFEIITIILTVWLILFSLNFGLSIYNLLFFSSSLIERILIEAQSNNKHFNVIVVDSAPWYEGRQLLHRLVRNNIQCTYVLLSATSFIMTRATKVFLGAHALLANGYVMGRAGSSQIALVAKYFNVPILVCCETYKFTERVQTDSIVFNELGKF